MLPPSPAVPAIPVAMLVPPIQPPRDDEPRAPAVELVMDIGSALHRYGAPAHRIESLLTAVSARLGLEARFYSTPTAILASFGPPEALRTGFIRVNPGEIDIERLARLDQLTQAVIFGEYDVAQAQMHLEAILSAPPRYSPLAIVLCYALSAAGFARLLGGGPIEVTVAGVASLLVGSLALGAERVPALGRVLEPTAAFVVSLVAVSASRLGLPLVSGIATVAGLIVLLPGLALTTALNELATQNLISGTSRLMAAALVFLELAFGVALGGQVATLLFGPAAQAVALPTPPEWTVTPALVLSTVALAVLFRARPRDVWGILATGCLGYVGVLWASTWLGPELGAFIGALVLGLMSNGIAILFDRPAMSTLVPGLILLVPGSVGFRSLESLLARDVVTGIGSAFSMVLVAIALVAGLLLSNALLPSRRAL